MRTSVTSAHMGSQIFNIFSQLQNFKHMKHLFLCCVFLSMNVLLAQEKFTILSSITEASNSEALFE